jgi:hypothetical protein
MPQWVAADIRHADNSYPPARILPMPETGRKPKDLV